MAAITPVLLSLLNAAGVGDRIVNELPPELQGIGRFMIDPGGSIGNVAYEKLMEAVHGTGPSPEEYWDQMTGDPGSMGLDSRTQHGPLTEANTTAPGTYMDMYPAPENYFSGYAYGGMVVPPYYNPGSGRMI